ncbi:MAG: PQQ-dependent sugar dehydrogenase [Planctomycetes bacterium]|nr:PQQ-dependent sugar dehydrogenase [Planctomycetota bacterium]
MKKQLALAAAVLVLAVSTTKAVTLSTVTLVSNLNRPVGAASTPALPNHLFVIEKRGVIKVIDMANSNAVTDVMNLTAVVHLPTGGSDEQGLLGLAFHPNYAVNRYLYVYYTTLNNASNVCVRYTANFDLITADNTTGVTLVTIPNVESNHNGGCLQFGPDGKLYVGSGDGGGAGDAHGAIGNGQALNTYLGKLLRIDVDIPAPYIPGDQPSVAGSAVDLKWAFGLRNPWRFSFDRANGDLYIADVGQGTWEEVNYVPAGTGGGRNYGWRCMEGNACFTSPSGTGCTCDINCDGAAPPAPYPALTCPVQTYDHSLGLSITGGYVYRGLEIPGEQGNYFYGDYSSGRIWTFQIDQGLPVNNTQRLTFSTLTSFGEDAKGEIYLVNGTGTTNGTIRRIVPSCNNKADINSDCAKDQLDIDILVNVLLGSPPADPALVNRTDVNDDTLFDGNDIRTWIDTPFP